MLLSILPREIVDIVLDFAVESDTEASLISQTCKTLLTMIHERRGEKMVLPFKLDVNRLSSSRELLLWAAKRPFYGGHVIPDAVIQTGDVELVKWLMNNGYRWESTTAAKIAGAGHLPLLQWIMADEDFRWDGQITLLASRGGHLEVLKWLRSQKYPWHEWCCRDAAAGGHMEVLDYLLSVKSHYWECSAYFGAILSGRLDIVKWLKERGCPLSAECCQCAAAQGNLEILKWLRANDCPWGVNMPSVAAYGGHLEILQWAVDNGCLWNLSTWSSAICTGNLEILKWLKSRGGAGRDRKYSWESDLASPADELELVKWLWGEGYYPEERCYDWMVKRGKVEILEWLRVAGYKPHKSSLCNMAVDRGQLETLKWLRANRCPWSESFCLWCVIEGRLEILKWARANGCPWGLLTLRSIPRKKQGLIMFNWLTANDCPP